MTESPEMPKYLKTSQRQYPKLEKSASLWINGKRPQKPYLPDRVNGVSKEFPKNLKIKDELINRITNPNPFLDEEVVISQKKYFSHEYSKVIKNTPARARFITPPPDIAAFTHRVKLLKNAELACQKFSETPSLVDPKIFNSDNLRYFSSFNVSNKKDSPISKSVMRVPQKNVEVYDCILNNTRTLKPPDIVLEANTPFEAKYFSVFWNRKSYAQLSNARGAFNIKKGMFTYLSDKTMRVKRLEEAEKLFSNSRLPPQTLEATKNTLAQIRQILTKNIKTKPEKYKGFAFMSRSKSLPKLQKDLPYLGIAKENLREDIQNHNEIKEIEQYELAKEKQLKEGLQTSEKIREHIRKIYNSIK